MWHRTLPNMHYTTTTQDTSATQPQFGFNLNVLQPGDVLLSVDTSKVSRRIAKATGGDYSHAMLYIGNSFIHAMTDGVYSKNPQRYLRENIDHLAAFRVIPELATLADFNAVCNFSRNQVGALYSIPQAAFARIPGKKMAKTVDRSGKQFCSRLVAQAFASIGVALVEDVDYCSPNDLARSPNLYRVEGAVRQMTNDEIAFSQTPDINATIQQRTYQWLEKSRRLAKRRGLGVIAVQNDVLPMLVRHPAYHRVVSGYVIDSGYADFYNWDREKNPYRYDTNVFLSMGSSAKELVQLLHVEWPSLKSELKRHETNIIASFGNFRNYHYLEYMRLTHDLTEKLFKETEQRKKTFMEVAKVLGVSLPEFDTLTHV